MNKRVSEADLQNLVIYLNKLTGNPVDYMSDGNANIGHYSIWSAYGRHQLQQIVSEGGTVITPLGGGFYTKRELHEMLNHFIVRQQLVKP